MTAATVTPKRKRRLLQAAAVTVGLSFLVSGCQTTRSYDELVGSGPLNLSTNQGASLEKYLALINGSNLAINVTSGQMFWNYCPDVQCASGDWKRVAVRDCESHFGGTCKLVASGKDIVWRGPVSINGVAFANKTPAAAESPPTSIDGIPALYRMKIGWGVSPGNWVDGKINLTRSPNTIAYKATFTDGVVCDGDVEISPQRHDVPATAPPSGRTIGTCLAQRNDKFRFEFEGPFETFGPNSGVILGRGDGRVQIEITYSDSN